MPFEEPRTTAGTDDTLSSLPGLPPRRDYKPRNGEPASERALPFAGPGPSDVWSVTPSGDDSFDEVRGAEYAAHLVQYLKDAPPGQARQDLLLSIFDTAAYQRPEAAMLRAGFVGFLETCLAQAAARLAPFTLADATLAGAAAAWLAEDEALDPRTAAVLRAILAR